MSRGLMFQPSSALSRFRKRPDRLSQQAVRNQPESKGEPREGPTQASDDTARGASYFKVASDGLDVAAYATVSAIDAATEVTNVAFGLARGIIRGPATVAENISGSAANPVSVVFGGIDTALGVAQGATGGALGFSKTLSEAAFGLTDTALEATDLVLDATGLEGSAHFQPGEYGGKLAQALTAALGLSQGNAEVMALLLVLLVEGQQEEAEVEALARGLRVLSVLQHAEQRRQLSGAKAPGAVTMLDELCSPSVAARLPLTWREDLPRAALFAAAAYGARWGGAAGLVPPRAARAMSDEAFVLHLTGIAKRDLLLFDWSSRAYSPGYYVALDHATRSVVIAFRGTVSGPDLVTNLTNEAIPAPPALAARTTDLASATGGTVCTDREQDSKGAYVHQGFWLAAEKLAGELHTPVTDALARHPGYSLRVCGHSLGAAVGSLLTLLWRHDPLLSGRIHCYAYAAPCILSKELAMQAALPITSIALGNDLVPSLCLSTARDLIAAARYLSEDVYGKLYGQDEKPSDGDAVHAYSCRDAAADLTSKATSELDDASEFELESLLGLVRTTCMQNQPKLYAAGPVVWLRSKSNHADVLVDPTVFNEIIISDDMFSTHAVTEYMATTQHIGSRGTL
ncbi:hypothetical protein CYMTET_12912 [Cymbomonas tetramitiformis]|uniref:sn-1-specific diacylglycerol lipase n=1 Tax=Cymbomonas tetramitiformis TaxID=36881 RepID=A0AAE0GJM5_9CHLO|nr:hypothetical protein CYMTET_12912 [Cymbomonas tetramitiformis]